MKRWMIMAVNGVLAVLILIGLPAAARLDVGPWELRSRDQVHQLVLGGAVLAALGNLAGSRWWARRRPDRRLCRQWLAGFALVGLVEAMILLRWIHFDWLRDLLR